MSDKNEQPGWQNPPSGKRARTAQRAEGKNCLTILGFDIGEVSDANPYEVCEIHGDKRLFVASFATLPEAEAFIAAHSHSSGDEKHE